MKKKVILCTLIITAMLGGCSSSAKTSQFESKTESDTLTGIEKNSEAQTVKNESRANIDPIDYQLKLKEGSVLGSSEQLCDVISDTLNQLGIKAVTSFHIVAGKTDGIQHDILIAADDMEFLAFCYYSEKDTKWACIAIYNSDRSCTYWVYQNGSSGYISEIVDYRTGEYILDDASLSVIDEYVDKENWFKDEDFLFYDENMNVLPFPEDDNLFSITDFDNAQTFRGCKVGDYAVNALEKYDLQYATLNFWPKKSKNKNIYTENQKKSKHYEEMFSDLNPDEILNQIYQVDTSAVEFKIGFDMTKFCNIIIPIPNPDRKISSRDRRGIGFDIEDNKISNIYVEYKAYH